MDAFFDFARDLPWLAFILICASYYTIKWVFRSINIGLRGWPPAHLDADGDHKSTTPESDQ